MNKNKPRRYKNLGCYVITHIVMHQSSSSLFFSMSSEFELLMRKIPVADTCSFPIQKPLTMIRTGVNFCARWAIDSEKFCHMHPRLHRHFGWTWMNKVMLYTMLILCFNFKMVKVAAWNLPAMQHCQFSPIGLECGWISCVS